MNTTIRGTGMELTEAIKVYAEEKVQSLEKFFDHIISADIDVGLRSGHHHKGEIFYAEVNLQVPHHDLVRVEKDAGDLYAAIDMVHGQLKLELEKMKEKMRAKDKEAIRDTKEYIPEE